jgi:hypothetical protein
MVAKEISTTTTTEEPAYMKIMQLKWSKNEFCRWQ